MAKDLKNDIDFLFEMGNIRLIDRMWRRFHTTNFANLADHHFRVFWRGPESVGRVCNYRDTAAC